MRLASSFHCLNNIRSSGCKIDVVFAGIVQIGRRFWLLVEALVINIDTALLYPVQASRINSDLFVSSGAKQTSSHCFVRNDDIFPDLEQTTKVLFV